jgi:hypothetical protein
MSLVVKKIACWERVNLITFLDSIEYHSSPIQTFEDLLEEGGGCKY